MLNGTKVWFKYTRHKADYIHPNSSSMKARPCLPYTNIDLKRHFTFKLWQNKRKYKTFDLAGVVTQYKYILCYYLSVNSSLKTHSEFNM